MGRFRIDLENEQDEDGDYLMVDNNLHSFQDDNATEDAHHMPLQDNSSTMAVPFYHETSASTALVMRPESPILDNDRIAEYHGTLQEAPHYDATAAPQQQQVHHYYYYNVAPPPPRRSSFSWWWMLFGGLGLVLAWLAHAPPPAPPPNTNTEESMESWSLYWDHHSQQLWSSSLAVLVETPVYLGRYKIRQWQSAFSQAYEEWNQLPSCPMQLTTTTGEEDDRDALTLLQESVVAQDVALEMVLDAVQAWWHSSETQTIPAQQQTTSLVLFFAGHPHVGMTQLAQALASKVLFPSYQADRMLDPVLVLSSAAQEAGGHPSAVRAAWSEALRVHLQTRPDALVLVTDVDQLDPLTWEWFLQQGLEELLLEDTTSSASTRRRVVIVLTSSVWGTQSIARHVRESGTLSSTSRVRLTADLAYELEPHLRMTSPTSSIASSNVGAGAGIVPVPFGPLAKPDLTRILEKQLLLAIAPLVAANTKMEVTQAVLDALLDDRHVEYLQWHQRDSSSSNAVLTVALEGAKVLQQKSPLWNKLQAQMHRCLVVPQKKQVVREQELSLVMDASGNGRYATFGWCRPREPATRTCKEQCRFLI